MVQAIYLIDCSPAEKNSRDRRPRLGFLPNILQRRGQRGQSIGLIDHSMTKWTNRDRRPTLTLSPT